MNTPTTIGSTPKGTILIVEDDRFLRDLITGKLEKEGYAIATAVDGKEGLEKLASERPLLVLLDLILPEVDGFEFLKRGREGAGSGMPPVIVLSNLGTKEDVERAEMLGAKAFLIKANFTPDEIIARVRTVLHEAYS